jgi:hypothetical protein
MQGTEAMKRTTLAMGLMVLLGIGQVGCKSASSLAWWKNNRSAESTAIAHSAPALPSDAAKKAEARPTNAAQLAGGDAAPYKPTTAPAAIAATSTTPANYPKTSAPAFTPSAAAQVAATTPTAPANNASLGSIAMPYDPSKAPQAKSTTTVAATAAPVADRYGAALANVAATTAPAAAPTLDPAVQVNQAVAAATGTVDHYASAAAGAAQGAVSPYVEDRYGIAPTTPSGAAGALASATTAGAVVSTPYRPGGTSTYPGGNLDATLQPGVQVASLPSSTTSNAPAPNAAQPSTTTPQPASPSRY